MFSAAITRVAHRTPSATSAAAASLNNTSSTAAAAAHRASQCIAARRPHQRRHSSSKTSCPPDSAGKPAPAHKAAVGRAEHGAVKSLVAEEIALQRSGKRVTKNKRQRTSGVEKAEDTFASLPSVPNTLIHRDELRVSNFYSMGRPLSLSSPIPPISTTEAFESIFEHRAQQHDPWENGNSAERRPEDVIYTLHNTIDALEGNGANIQDDNVRWEIIAGETPSNENGVAQLIDGASRARSLDEVVAQFKPFHVPPPPQAFVEDKPSSSASKQTRSAKAEQKSFSTTITVTESRGINGERTFFAQSTPMVPTSTSTPVSAGRASQGRWQFRERMQQRQRTSLRQTSSSTTSMIERSSPQRSIRQAPRSKRSRMFTISVRRQRKLKMKKHKLSKLRKRTRTLRRRQDRA